jgi:hypothetical protein
MAGYVPQLMAIAAAMIGYILYLFFNGGPGNLTEVKSTVDGKMYQVQDLPNKQGAADMLAKIQANVQKVVDYYRKDEFKTDRPAELFVERYNPQNMMENSVTSGETSYSENKGEKIVLCIRDKTKPPNFPLVDMNTVMFVVLHEMAHLMTQDISSGKHTPEFWANFRRLLEDSAKIGIYQPVNYSRAPQEYCGMTITDSPL